MHRPLAATLNSAISVTFDRVPGGKAEMANRHNCCETHIAIEETNNANIQREFRNESSDLIKLSFNGEFVSVKDLTKRFPRSVVTRRRTEGGSALNGVSFDARRGEVIALLGENGAGKTTLLKIIATLITPTSGTVLVMGHNVVNDDNAARSHITFTTNSERSFYYRLDGWQNLRFFCGLYGMAMKQVKENVEPYLDPLSMRKAMTLNYMYMSTGMRRKLSFLRTLSLDKPVMLLDEPTSNMDPRSSEEVSAIIRDLRQRGNRTILLSTNNLEDAESLADRVLILSGGRLVFSGKPPSKTVLRGVVEIVLEDALYTDMTKILPGARKVLDGDGMHFLKECDDAITELNMAIDMLRSGGVTIKSARLVEQSLQELFVTKTRGDIHE